MNPWIDSLLELQATDMRIRQLSTRLDMIPTELSRLDGELEHQKNELKKLKDSGMSTDMEIRQVESEIMKTNDALDKLKQQSAMVRKNEEYKALLNEMATLKAKISDLETRELELMEAKDKFGRQYERQEILARNKGKNLDGEKADLEALALKLEKELDALKLGRPPLCAPIEPELLDKYTQLLNKGVGKPVAEIHDGNCGNCHLKLTPQTLNSADKGLKVQCDNCGHLLYIVK